MQKTTELALQKDSGKKIMPEISEKVAFFRTTLNRVMIMNTFNVIFPLACEILSGTDDLLTYTTS